MLRESLGYIQIAFQIYKKVYNKILNTRIMVMELEVFEQRVSNVLAAYMVYTFGRLRTVWWILFCLHWIESASRHIHRIRIKKITYMGKCIVQNAFKLNCATIDWRVFLCGIDLLSNSVFRVNRSQAIYWNKVWSVIECTGN